MCSKISVYFFIVSFALILSFLSSILLNFQTDVGIVAVSSLFSFTIIQLNHTKAKEKEMFHLHSSYFFGLKRAASEQNPCRPIMKMTSP